MEHPEPDEATRRRAQRHVRIIYAVMAFLILLPFIIFAVMNALGD